MQTRLIRPAASSLFGGSNVLAGLHEGADVDTAFAEWLPGHHAHLLYRSTRDGANAAAFHEACDGRGPTVTLIRSDNGYVFGGYAGISWESIIWHSSWKVDLSAFLFTVTNPRGYPITRFLPRDHDKQIQCGAWLGPSFGLGDDLRISNKFDGHSYSFLNNSFVNSKYGDATFTGSHYFTPEEVEVWAIGRERPVL